MGFLSFSQRLVATVALVSALSAAFVQEKYGGAFLKKGTPIHERSMVRLSESSYRGQGENTEAGIDNDEESAEIAAFRARLILGGLDAVSMEPVGAAARAEAAAAIWARRSDKTLKGTVLLGNEDFFFGAEAKRREGDDAFSSTLLRVGLPPDTATRFDGPRRTVLLPVCIVLSEKDGLTGQSGHSAVLFGRRSGGMMGDSPDLDSTGFRLQPIFLGGPSPAGDLELRTAGSPEGAGPTGILAIHPYSEVDGAQPLTEDGLFVGGNWSSAKKIVTEPENSPFRFQFFVRACNWGPGELEKEIAAGAWTAVDCSTELLLKERDRTTPALWQDIMDELEKDPAKDNESPQ